MKLRIISSTQTIFENDTVTSVSVPGGVGIMQILPNHENIVSTLEIGEAVIAYEDGKERVFLNGGFIVVRNNEILILANEADREEGIVKEELDKAIERAQEQIGTVLEASELIQLEKMLKYQKFIRDRVVQRN